MHTDLHDLFQDSGQKAPAGLRDSIHTAISLAKARHARNQTILWGTFTTLSLGTFVASGFYAASSASASGFSTYFSLLFSDGSAALALWREIGLSLLESLPVLAIVATLASVCAVLWSVRNLSKHTGASFITTANARIA